MSYQIDASLQQGIPSLKLFDARSGEERLCWQQPLTADENEIRRAMYALFKRLVLLSSCDSAVDSREHRPYPVKAAQHVPQSTRETANRPRPDNVFYLPLKRRSVAR